MGGRTLSGTSVALVGAGMSNFGVFRDLSARDLLTEAFLEMMASIDFRIDPQRIDAIYLANFSSELFQHQGHLAPILAEWIGLAPRPAVRVENACASGGSALRQGIMAIASGMADMVLVAGVEKMTHHPTETVTDTLATAGDMLYETCAGFTFPGYYGVMANAYRDRYGGVMDVMQYVAIKNHHNGSLNPHAHFRHEIPAIMEKIRQGRSNTDWRDLDDFLQDDQANPLIAHPLRLFDCSPISDGAAAVLLASSEIAHAISRTPIHIIGSGQASDGGFATRENLTSIPSACRAAQSAYQVAGVRPEDIQMAEVHDCFTIAEIIAMEDLGFCLPGESRQMILDGMTQIDGTLPINTSGGLKAKGHPVGASGVAQVVEVWQQMRGEAGERQIPGDVHLALTHNVGGTGQTSVVHLFEKR